MAEPKITNTEKELFAHLTAPYKDKLFSYIFYSMQDEATAWDIYQDTMLKALTKISIYQENGNFKAWLFTIAANKMKDYYRTSWRIVALEEDDTWENAQTDDTTASMALANISLQQLMVVLQKLPEQQKEVIILRQYFSFKEISQMLDCPIGTVLARMNRGIKKLQILLKD